MHLSRLTLTNVRQFGQRTFEFQPGFNLLVGENGAGKSTVLRSILAVLGSAQQLGRRPKLEDDDIRLRSEHAKIIAEVHTPTRHIQQFYFQKRIWERAERSTGKKTLPLVLLYASNEATCASMKVRRYPKALVHTNDNLRRDEAFLYEMEMEQELIFSRQFPKSHERGRFGNSESIRRFVGKVLTIFSGNFQQFYWRFEPYECSIDLASKKWTVV